MKRLLSILSVGAFLALSMGGSAFAGSATANITVQGTLAANCTIATTTEPSAFTLVPGSQPAQSEGALTVNCTNGTTYRIGLNVGLYGTGDGTSSPLRYMENASAYQIGYQVYLDSGQADIFGDGPLNEEPGTGTGMATADQRVVDFWVLPSSVSNEAPTGSYSDTLTATIAY